MPLSFAVLGKQVVVQATHGNIKLKQHLLELGFNIGAPVTVISSLNGNVIVKVKNIRIAVEKSLANKIICA